VAEKKYIQALWATCMDTNPKLQYNDATAPIQGLINYIALNIGHGANQSQYVGNKFLLRKVKVNVWIGNVNIGNSGTQSSVCADYHFVVLKDRQDQYLQGQTRNGIYGSSNLAWDPRYAIYPFSNVPFRTVCKKHKFLYCPTNTASNNTMMVPGISHVFKWKKTFNIEVTTMPNAPYWFTKTGKKDYYPFLMIGPGQYNLMNSGSEIFAQIFYTYTDV